MTLPFCRSVAVYLVPAAVLIIGWDKLWFLTDDTFIYFRYLSNAKLGFGYVWNPPPFLPVEGYTSLLWLLGLDFSWRILGIEPPIASNLLSLTFALLGLYISFKILKYIKSLQTTSDSLFSDTLIVLSLLGIATNLTFITWASSGLETALFNFLLLLLVYRTFFFGIHPKNVLIIGLVSSILTLTRPDGLLFCVILAPTCYYALRLSNISRYDSLLYTFTPYLLVITQIAWRYFTYGDILPNTYYAKSTPYTISNTINGLEYIASFVVLYGFYFSPTLAFAAMFSGRHKGTQRSVVTSVTLIAATKTNITKIALLVVLLLHIAFYAIRIGGDHFEFRVVSYLVPLYYFFTFYLLCRVKLKPWTTVTLLACQLTISSLPAWLDFSASRENTGNIMSLAAPSLASAFPLLPQGIVSPFHVYDTVRNHLINQGISCKHRQFSQNNITRENIDYWQRPTLGTTLSVLPYHVVGRLSWIKPDVAIIDTLGLNDRVIARNGDVRPDAWMAHQRQPPSGYLECFFPRLTNPDALIWRDPEVIPHDRIELCERRYNR